MYTKNVPLETTLEINDSYIGETIEQRVEKMVYNNEPIADGSPLIYTDRRKGVIPETNIRTDRFDIALENMDKVHTDKLAKRVELYQPKDGSTQGTGNEQPSN